MQDRRSHDDEGSKEVMGRSIFQRKFLPGNEKREERRREKEERKGGERKRRIFQLFWLKSIVKSSQREEGEDIS